jgi:hypothetical protein
MFWDFPDAYQAARVGNWKWVSFTPRGRRGEVPDKEELFDLAADPGEKNDLAAAEPQRTPSSPDSKALPQKPATPNQSSPRWSAPCSRGPSPLAT